MTIIFRTRSAVGKAAGKEGDVGYARCDVTDRSSFESAFEKCVERFGCPPDVLINAAGIAGEQRWEKLYDINLVRKGIQCCKMFSMGKIFRD